MQYYKHTLKFMIVKYRNKSTKNIHYFLVDKTNISITEIQFNIHIEKIMYWPRKIQISVIFENT